MVPPLKYTCTPYLLPIFLMLSLSPLLLCLVAKNGCSFDVTYLWAHDQNKFFLDFVILFV